MLGRYGVSPIFDHFPKRVLTGTPKRPLSPHNHLGKGHQLIMLNYSIGVPLGKKGVTACAKAHRLEKSSLGMISILGGAVVGAAVVAVVGTAVGLAPHAEGAVVGGVVGAVAGRPTR